MYIFGVPKKEGLYWVKENLGPKGHDKPKLCRLKRLSLSEPEGILYWWIIEDNEEDNFLLAAGRDLYWDIQVTEPKEYECLRRIDDTIEEQGEE